MTIQFTGNEVRPRFFVFHKDSSYGRSYDPHRNSENNRRLPVDSALRGIKGTNNFEKILTLKPDSSSWNPDRSELKEVYVQKASRDTPAIRVSFYYTRHQNFQNESLNPGLDSARKMKLYKYEYLIGKFYNAQAKQWSPEITFRTEMKEVMVEDVEEVMSYLIQYKSSMTSDRQNAAPGAN